MKLIVLDVNKFNESIHDFIYEQYNIIPDIYINDEIENTQAYSYNPELKILSKTNCIIEYLHYHENFPKLFFCSSPEILAINYITSTIHKDYWDQLFSTLKNWLPVVTLNLVECIIVSNEIETDLNLTYFVNFENFINNSMVIIHKNCIDCFDFKISKLEVKHGSSEKNSF